MNNQTLQKLNEMFIRIRPRDLVFFMRNVGLMVKAGLPLARALSVLEHQTDNVKLRRTVRALALSVEKGESFSASLARFPKVFSPLMVAMVSAGEESGKLPATLESIAHQSGKADDVRKKVRGAFLYPAVVLCAMVVVGIILLVTVVPVLSSTFAELHVDLPWTTRLLLGVSGALVGYPVFFSFLGIAGIALVLWLRGVSRVRRSLAALFLRLPLTRTFVVEVNTALVARTLATLLSSGVDVVRALSITSRVVQNVEYRTAIARAEDMVSRGDPLSRVFRAHARLFPALLPSITEVGEETGQLSSLLAEIADFYEAEVDNRTRNVSTLVEPILMIVVGIVVGFFAVSTISPVYSISQAI